LTYTYNGDGLLYRRITPTETSTNIWDLASNIPQLLSDGQNTYIPGVGYFDGQDWHYYLPDGQGTVRQLADAQGYLEHTYDYSPFGRLVESEGQQINALQYTGEYHDEDAGLVYLRARRYDPAVGPLSRLKYLLNILQC